MTKIEKVELCLIALLVLVLMLVTSTIQTTFSMVVLYSAALLFCQSLLRDFWYLYVKRSVKLSKSITRQCMCVESTVGMLGVIVGLLIFSSNIDFIVSLNKISFIIIMSTVLIIGFVLKDYVIEWSPWRIYKEKDHMNIVFAWNKS